MNCLLTGGSGILGSHIIFEWLKKALTNQTVDHLFVIIRNKNVSAEERLHQIFESESCPTYLKKFGIKKCLSKITVIASDLINISKQTFDSYNFKTVIHCAGSTNLSHAINNEEDVFQQNFLATKKLLDNLPKTVNRFIYISTAFSYGIQKEKVNDSIENYSVNEFRNPYEKSKYETELTVKKVCEEKNIIAQILRPSIICGRLIDKPFFEIPKFDVFYAWAIFLDKYATKVKDNFRIWIDKESGLNIVPVDFVSKIILHAFLNPEIKELNIVNPKPILHIDYIGSVLESFAVKNYEYSTEKPSNLNNFEQLYYKTIGAIFEKYVSVPDLKFDTKNILKLIKQLKLELSLDMQKNFMDLINFSVEKKFKKSY